MGKLQKMLRHGAHMLLKAHKFNPDQMHNYYMSGEYSRPICAITMYMCGE